MNLSLINPSQQRGFSLIELMVAMVLGLFILAGLLSLFIGYKQGFRVQEAVSRLQDNARFALEIVNREVRKTGYKTAFTNMTTAFPAVTGSFVAGQAVLGTDTSLTLRYQGSGTSGGDGWTKDCLSANLAEGDLATITLFVNGQSELACTSDNSTLGGSPQTLPLVGDVQALRFSYGEDTDGDAYADVYVAAGAVTDWTRIASIRIDLLLVTADDGLVDDPVPYTWNGTTVTPADQRMRRVYSNVIGLRNLLP